MPHSDRVDHSATRREFLKSSSAVLTTTALASALASRAHASEDHTLKVALIGCGARGTGAAAQALNTNGPVKLWAMADAFPDRLQSSLENLRNGLPARYDRDESRSLTDRI